jgi:hypothetical protein
MNKSNGSNPPKSIDTREGFNFISFNSVNTGIHRRMFGPRREEET